MDQEPIDIMNVLGLIIASILAFVLPVIGLVPSIYLFAKRRIYPTSVKIVAITAIVYQVIVIILALLGVWLFFIDTSSQQMDISNVTTEIQK